MTDPGKHAGAGRGWPWLGSLFVVPLCALAGGSRWSFPLGAREVPLRHDVVAALLLVAWIRLRAASRAGRASGPARAVLWRWQRLDPLLAAVLVYAMLFVAPATLAGPAAVVLGLAAAIALLRRLPARVLLGAAVFLALLVLVVPRVLSAYVVARVGQEHEFNLEHRLKPDGKDINPDRIRFRGTSQDLTAEDFVVLFLGDSFTFGKRLTYEQAYPYQFEAIAAGEGCRLRAVNFGWTSASPLLALRILRDTGVKYQPDLVVYSLDMTDFRDDLRYERALGLEQERALSPGQLIEGFVLRRVPGAERLQPLFAFLRRHLRAAAAARDPDLTENATDALPEDRFFVTAQPLAQSRELIERGVMRNLAALEALCRESLGVPFVVVLYPRAYQYSTREVPDNWEKADYEILGPYTREPFRYFEEVAGRLPYPVLNLLPVFEQSSEFPLFLDDDPHWNPRGARFTARAVFDALGERRLLPCR